MENKQPEGWRRDRTEALDSDEWLPTVGRFTNFLERIGLFSAVVPSWADWLVESLKQIDRHSEYCGAADSLQASSPRRTRVLPGWPTETRINLISIV